MLRKMIRIDREKCNGCGACAAACHEGAIDMVDGKAVLTREHFCDGLGDCLPACPAGAITVTDNNASIDYTKCTSCGVCVEKCPRKLITDIHATGKVEPVG